MEKLPSAAVSDTKSVLSAIEHPVDTIEGLWNDVTDPKDTVGKNQDKEPAPGKD